MLHSLSSDAPSAGLRRMLETKLDTFEKVELVTVLTRRDHHQDTLDGLARELQVGHDVLERLALDLARSGLVDVAGEGVRLTASPAEHAIIAEAAQIAHGKLRSLMSTVALDRIRGLAAPGFAVLSPLRKPKDEG